MKPGKELLGSFTAHWRPSNLAAHISSFQHKISAKWIPTANSVIRYSSRARDHQPGTASRPDLIVLPAADGCFSHPPSINVAILANVCPSCDAPLIRGVKHVHGENAHYKVFSSNVSIINSRISSFYWGIFYVSSHWFAPLPHISDCLPDPCVSCTAFISTEFPSPGS